MKYLLISFFLSFCILGRSQVVEVNKKDLSNCNTLHYLNFERNVPVLLVDSCLLSVLKEIYERDTRCSYYKPDKSCFLLSSDYQVGYHLINIRPTYIDKLDSASYFGVIDLKHTKYICYGDFNKSLFYKSNSDSLNIIYHKVELKTINDTLDYFSDNRLLCDGCLKRWSITCNNTRVVINAEICNTSLPNSSKSTIKKHRKK